MNYNNIIKELETKGYAEIDNFISNENIRNVNKFIDLKKNEFNSDNFSLADNELSHNVFNEIKNSKKFIDLYENILKSQNIFINSKEKRDFHTVLGVRKGKEIKFKKPIMYHFDAFLITINIPIKVPENNVNDGKLVVWPNIRRIQKNMITNFAIKLLFQNKLARYLINLNILQSNLNIKKFSLNKDKIYIFYGYRSLHGVDKLGNKNERTTLLYHIYNPHKDAFLNKYILKRNTLKRNEIKKIKS